MAGQAGARVKPVFFGSFEDEIEAAKMYNEYAHRTYGGPLGNFLEAHPDMAEMAVF